MFIFWGSGVDQVQLGEAGTRPCRACRQGRPFLLLLEYGYLHLYEVFGLVTWRRFLLVCQHCGNSWKAEPDEVPDAKHLARTTIPFFRRWGCLIFLLLAVIGFAIFAALLEWNYRRAHGPRPRGRALTVPSAVGALLPKR
jgi:hypothetical protein